MDARHGTAVVAGLLLAACGRELPSGKIEGARRPAQSIEREALAQRQASAALRSERAAEPADKQILFGDLHVHTTYSVDAFAYALPLFGGEGAAPPADACDFARYCSALDFFAITDHAEGLTPEYWQSTKETIRECDARAGDPANPDLVAFVGWEWTQVGSTPETHYGHKNVIFPGLADAELPARPITALDQKVMSQRPNALVLNGIQVLGGLAGREYADFLWLIGRLAGFAACEPGVDTRKLRPDCREDAATPRELFDKLDQWGLDAIVIPHGLAWGLHAPLGASLDNQLDRTDHDPARQTLLEVFSGHGNSEEYRRGKNFETDASGQRVCPEPTRDFLPCCWQAGEIMRMRCGDLPAAECAARVEEAKRLALAANTAPHLVFPDTRPEDWLDCDQCRDCFKPAFALRPGESAQYGLAVSNQKQTDRDGRPLRFRWGFIASSDDHRAQPGTGYKQYARSRMTDTRGVQSEWLDSMLRPRLMGQADDPRRPQKVEREERSFGALLDVERVASFMVTGGLAAVHAAGRSREAIWDALKRREVYGTSGPRILLWFDLLNGPAGRAPMGSEVALAETPRFEVRAAGSFVQKPGCPEESAAGMSRARIDELCLGECYNPGDRRHPIVAIEVIRVRPQKESGENVDRLIEDPWRRFDCPPDPRGCTFAFEDPDYVRDDRDSVYYVRALQEETPAIDGAGYRVQFDASGNAVGTSPCNGNYRTPFDDDCLAPVNERAWSSPIYVDQGHLARDRPQ